MPDNVDWFYNFYQRDAHPLQAVGFFGPITHIMYFGPIQGIAFDSNAQNNYQLDIYANDWNKSEAAKINHFSIISILEPAIFDILVGKVLYPGNKYLNGIF